MKEAETSVLQAAVSVALSVIFSPCAVCVHKCVCVWACVCVCMSECVVVILGKCVWLAGSESRLMVQLYASCEFGLERYGDRVTGTHTQLHTQTHSNAHTVAHTVAHTCAHTFTLWCTYAHRFCKHIDTHTHTPTHSRPLTPMQIQVLSQLHVSQLMDDLSSLRALTTSASNVEDTPMPSAKGVERSISSSEASAHSNLPNPGSGLASGLGSSGQAGSNEVPIGSTRMATDPYETQSHKRRLVADTSI